MGQSVVSGRPLPGGFRSVVKRSVLVAMVVGPTLTLINQWDAVIALEGVRWGTAGLTMLVPFCVSCLSGLLTARSFRKWLVENAAMHEDDGTSAPHKIRHPSGRQA